MKQFTTPTETLTFGMDISTGYDVWVYLKSGNQIVEKVNSDLTITPADENKCIIEFDLTQEETGLLAKGETMIELTCKHRASGKVYKSNTAYIKGVKSLKKGVV